MGAHSPLAGRASEIDALVGLVRQAVAGRAGAALVTGEAGVGKTALLRVVCREIADEADVLWATCLPLASLAVPFLPLTTALRAQGRMVFEPAAFDEWLDAACRQRPVLLVVDDLQWADESSLDLLMYVIAGSRTRRLAVVATVRSGQTNLTRWLANVRRLPGVAECALDRLDRVATGEQLAGLLGGPPHESLVDDVFAATRGNAYLTTLLVRGLAPGARSLPGTLPGDLRDAVTHAWQALPAPARELTKLVAVAGRPQPAERLGAVASATGLAAPALESFRDALDAGVLEVDPAGRYWFVHPLLAEVLEDALLPQERRAWHIAYAETETEAVDRADHYYRAGATEDAYRWAIRAAEAAERAGGDAEMLRLLRRALALGPGRSRLELLLKIRAAADRAGRFADELTAVEELLTLVDADRQPLLRSQLLIRRMRLRHLTGQAFFPLDDARAAVDCAAADPDSAEYATAVGHLAQIEFWHGESAGPARAAEALRLARRCGSPAALSAALVATMTARTEDVAAVGDLSDDAVAAQDAAAQARYFIGFVGASILWASSIDGPASHEYVACLRDSRETLTRLRAPHAYVAWLSAWEAVGLLILGDWRGCADRLRITLGRSPGPRGEVMARLTAALLAGWQGRPAEAEAHLARADEIYAGHAAFRNLPFSAVRAELSIATGQTGAVLAAVLLDADNGVTSTLCERLIPLAARALADESQRRRDTGADPAPTIARLDELRRRHPSVLPDLQPGPVYRRQVQAMQLLYDAEAARALDAPDAGPAWVRTADACHAALLPWDEAYACWRAAQAMLGDRTGRDTARAVLRRGYALAVDLQASSLRAQVEALARAARQPLTAPAAVAVPTASLTKREREILAHIVAGRTYHEIAQELFVSEKTVSVHVSNLLRKTGAANRVQLAQLAQRRGYENS